MHTFHIIFYENPGDTLSKGQDIEAISMESALLQFGDSCIGIPIACFDKETLAFGVKPLPETEETKKSADRIHEEREYEDWVKKYDEILNVIQESILPGMFKDDIEGMEKRRKFIAGSFVESVHTIHGNTDYIYFRDRYLKDKGLL